MANGGDGYPELQRPHDVAGHHGRGRGRLHHRELLRSRRRSSVVAPGASRARTPNPGDGTELPDHGRISLTSVAPASRAHDRAGAPRLMAAGRRLLSASCSPWSRSACLRPRPVTMASPASSSIRPRINPGEVIVVAGRQVSTDDPVRVELVSGVTRIELGTAVTDGEGHFTIGATIPPETAVGPYTIEVEWPVWRPHVRAPDRRRSPRCYDGQNGAPPGRDEGLPAMPSVEGRVPDQLRQSAARCSGTRSRPRPAGGPRACGRRVRPVHALEPATGQAHDRFDRLALASCGDPAAPGDPQATARPAGRLPAQGRARRRAVRRQGAEPAQPGALVLAEAGAAACPGRRPPDPGSDRPRRRRRVHADRFGVRGPAARVEPHQAVPAAVQRPAQGRQELPVHQDHARRRLPAHRANAQARERRFALLRAVRIRVVGGRVDEPRPAAVPVPDLHDRHP